MFNFPRHFLSLLDFTPEELRALISRAIILKQMQTLKKEKHETLPNKVLAMIFEKSSTRTRVSFEAGISHLGGNAIFLTPENTQLGRGEPIEDSARVISSMVDLVVIRTFEHEIAVRFANYSSVPVINALTNMYHPCQLLADMLTYQEHKGEISGKKVCWLGDGNNMCHSYINAAKQFDFELRICCPSEYKPDDTLLEKNKERAQLISDPNDAIANADLVVTDVWTSMGQEHEADNRKRKFQRYQLNKTLLSYANSDVLYLHCLPAHRGEEISAELLDAPDTVIWEAAENRLHSQKALMELLLGI
ncbi:MAG: ornithine carbamoyltransferase [Halieaceae bacterium]|nr:ornithine carbamoyltransferase [Halieaceae bacterium]